MLISPNSVIQGDCLEVMPHIEAGSIDMILADLPYGTTACKWDSIIPFEPLWKEYKRIIKPQGAIVLTASQPFTSALVMSNLANFKYCWIWDKGRPGNPMQAKRQPLKIHEDVCVFSLGVCNYYPRDLKVTNKPRGGINPSKTELGYGKSIRVQYKQQFYDYPKSILRFVNNNTKNVHPTQKPVSLFEYLIKTYTNEGALVLDNTAGSGTTAIAAINTNRRYILIEKEPKYVEICNKRIEEALQKRQAA